jgi:hypothetical protein
LRCHNRRDNISPNIEGQGTEDFNLRNCDDLPAIFEGSAACWEHGAVLVWWMEVPMTSLVFFWYARDAFSKERGIDLAKITLAGQEGIQRRCLRFYGTRKASGTKHRRSPGFASAHNDDGRVG